MACKIHRGVGTTKSWKRHGMMTGQGLYERLTLVQLTCRGGHASGDQHYVIAKMTRYFQLGKRALWRERDRQKRGKNILEETYSQPDKRLLLLLLP